MKAVLFNGSPRKEGNTAQALKIVEEVLTSNGIETETVRIGGTGLRGCIACYKCKEKADRKCHGIKDDGLNEFIARMIEADAVVIASPTYFGNVSAEVKALIDRCGLVSRVNGGLFKRKAGAAVSVARRAGAVDTISAIHNFFLLNEMVIPGSSYWNLCIGLMPGDIQNDQEGLQTIKTLAENLSWLVKKIVA